MDHWNERLFETNKMVTLEKLLLQNERNRHEREEEMDRFHSDSHYNINSSFPWYYTPCMCAAFPETISGYVPSIAWILHNTYYSQYGETIFTCVFKFGSHFIPKFLDGRRAKICKSINCLRMEEKVYKEKIIITWSIMSGSDRPQPFFL